VVIDRILLSGATHISGQKSLFYTINDRYSTRILAFANVFNLNLNRFMKMVYNSRTINVNIQYLYMKSIPFPGDSRNAKTESSTNNIDDDSVQNPKFSQIPSLFQTSDTKNFLIFYIVNCLKKKKNIYNG